MLRLLFVIFVVVLLVAIMVYLSRKGNPIPGEDRKTAEKQAVEKMQGFLQHLGAFAIVVGMLFVLNLVTSRESWWFLWVAFFWGIGLAFHAYDVFIGENTELARRITGHRLHPRPAPEPRVAGDAERSMATPPTEISDILREGSALVDRMRTDARLIPRSEARREALAACAASDQVLSAIEDHPEEVILARDFLHQFLQPGSQLIRDYARLASRDVPSARRTVAEVEANDLPALTRRANAIYDRMHRGTLIDLEVAREMMALDVPIPVVDGGNDDPRQA